MDEYVELLRWAGNALLWAGALIGTANVAVHARVPWWRTRMGRHLMVFMGAVAIVYVLGAIRTLTGDSWWFLLLRLLAFAAVPVAMAQRLYLQIQAQRTVRRVETLPRKEPRP